MLNFIQPKTVLVDRKKPSIEEQIPVIKNAVDFVNPKNSNYVIHKVSPNETLDRICLIYNCPKDAIRKANGFTGDEIFMKKELIIPSSRKSYYFFNYF
jgi:LysM repeat protein